MARSFLTESFRMTLAEQKKQRPYSGPLARLPHLVSETHHTGAAKRERRDSVQFFRETKVVGQQMELHKKTPII